MKNKVAIITGSSKGIGRVIAKKLASSGISVVINYLDSPLEAESLMSEITSFNGSTISIKADVSSEDQIHQLVDETLSAFGRIDILRPLKNLCSK